MSHPIFVWKLWAPWLSSYSYNYFGWVSLFQTFVAGFLFSLSKLFQVVGKFCEFPSFGETPRRGRSWTAKLQLATICGFRDKPTCSWNKQTGRENCYKIQYKKAIFDEVSSWLWFYRFPFTLKIWSKIKAIPPKSLYLLTNQTGWGLQKSLTPNPWTNGPLKNNNWHCRNLLRWRTLTWKWLYSCT